MKNEILVETSARHVHVTAEDMEKLLGKGNTLTVKKMLSQPGQFASNERSLAHRCENARNCRSRAGIRRY